MRKFLPFLCLLFIGCITPRIQATFELVELIRIEEDGDNYFLIYSIGKGEEYDVPVKDTFGLKVGSKMLILVRR